MENTPPPPQQPQAPFAPPPQTKQGKPVLWIVLGVVAVCGCVGTGVLAAILFPVFAQAKIAAKRTASMSNLKRCGIASIMYSADWDDRLPQADRWIDLTVDYAKDESIYHAITMDEPPVQNYGYAFREELSKRNSFEIVDIDSTAMIFDSTVGGRNAAGTLATLPRPGRYGGKNTMVMADTSAKAVNPADAGPMSQVK